jgi:hypothetical protein
MDRRQADARATQWLLEVDRALLALRRCDTENPSAQDVPAEAGPRNKRSGTTRYSAPAGESVTGMRAGPDERATGTAASASTLAMVAHPDERSEQSAAAFEHKGQPAVSNPARRYAQSKQPSSRADSEAASLVPLTANPMSTSATRATAGGDLASIRGNASAEPIRSNRATIDGHGARLAHGMPMSTTRGAAKDVAAASTTSANRLGGHAHAPVASRFRVSAAPVAAAGELSYVASKAVSATTPALRSALMNAAGEAEQTEQADEHQAAHSADAPRGEPFDSKHVHVDVDEHGVHAYLRDASLDTDDLLAVAEAVYTQGMLGDAPLASVTINGAVMPRPLHRVLRAGSHDAYDDGLDDQESRFILQKKGRIVP